MGTKGSSWGKVEVEVGGEILFFLKFIFNYFKKIGGSVGVGER